MHTKNTIEMTVNAFLRTGVPQNFLILQSDEIDAADPTKYVFRSLIVLAVADPHSLREVQDVLAPSVFDWHITTATFASTVLTDPDFIETELEAAHCWSPAMLGRYRRARKGHGWRVSAVTLQRATGYRTQSPFKEPFPVI